jgi:hypothetical protein
MRAVLDAGSRKRETNVGMPPKTSAKTFASSGILAGGNILHVNDDWWNETTPPARSSTNGKIKKKSSIARWMFDL